MATKTTNYQLTKPEGSDLVDIDVLNENFDIIDTQLKAGADALENKQDPLTFDESPTEGSLNPVTSAGIYAALKGAGGIPDWDESDETADGYIKNRPFFRTVESSETIFKIGQYTGKISGSGPNWISSRSYDCSTRFVTGAQYRVTVTYHNITMTRLLTAAYYRSDLRLSCDEFYITQLQTSSYKKISAAFSVSAFGEGHSGEDCGFEVILDTYAYTKLPEEYLDTGFAAPEFADTDRVETGKPDYSAAYLLLFAGESYYRNNVKAVFTSLLAATEISAKISSLESSVNGQAEQLENAATAISALQERASSVEAADQEQAGQILDLQSRAASIEETVQSQSDLIESLQEQIGALTSRVAYLESLHSDDGVTVTKEEDVLSIDGTGAGVEDGELIINAGSISVVDGELVCGSGSSGTMSVDEDGTLALNGSGIAEADGELTISSGSILVSDGALTTGAQSQSDTQTQAEVTDGVVSVSGGEVDESGVLTIDSESISVSDGVLSDVQSQSDTQTEVTDGIVSVSSGEVDESGTLDPGTNAAVEEETITIE